MYVHTYEFMYGFFQSSNLFTSKSGKTIIQDEALESVLM